MKTRTKISILSTLMLITSNTLAACKDYNADAVHDGHLTVSEAISHYNCGKGKRVIVFSHLLTVHRPNAWNSDNWAKGIVQGLLNDFWVHGRVGMKKRADGVRIQPEKYNFDIRNDGSAFRNAETVTGRIIAGNGTPFVIVFKGSPKVITNGYTYGQ